MRITTAHLRFSADVLVETRRREPMQYGAFLPHIGPLARGDVLTHIRSSAQTAEALGFDSVWVGDHIVTPTHIACQYPYSSSGAFPLNAQEPVLEPLNVVSFGRVYTRSASTRNSVLHLPTA